MLSLSGISRNNIELAQANHGTHDLYRKHVSIMSSMRGAWLMIDLYFAIFHILRLLAEALFRLIVYKIIGTLWLWQNVDLPTLHFVYWSSKVVSPSLVELSYYIVI